MTERRIKPGDSISDIIERMADGKAAVYLIVRELLLWGGTDLLKELDKQEIYGDSIVLVYKNICDGDIENLRLLLKYWGVGLLKPEVAAIGSLLGTDVMVSVFKAALHSKIAEEIGTDKTAAEIGTKLYEDIERKIKQGLLVYWECNCCMCILLVSASDTATSYECPQCKAAGCGNPGTFVKLEV